MLHRVQQAVHGSQRETLIIGITWNCFEIATKVHIKTLTKDDRGVQPNKHFFQRETLYTAMKQ